MGKFTDRHGRVMRDGALVLALLGIVHVADTSGWLSMAARPLVVLAAKALGFAAAERGADIVIGALVLPWTQDCSGVNTLIMMWGVTLWANRTHRLWPTLIGRIAMCVPAALAANVLRILMLAGYRYIHYPEWESPELHYFVGFLSLAPFAAVYVLGVRERSASEWLDILYMAVVLALVAPGVFSPGGSLIVVCAIVCLMENGYRSDHSRWAPVVVALWAGMGLLVAWSRMESLWVPWVLACPLFAPPKLLRSPSGWVILSGTVPLLALHPVWRWVVLAAIGHYGYRRFRDRPGAPGAGARRSPKALTAAAVVLVLMAPFSLPGLIGIRHPVLRPPAGVMARQLSFDSYSLRITGQAPDIGMYWFGGTKDGRHHALESCMRFRGIVLRPENNQPHVLYGDGQWMREFFIHDSRLSSAYSDYLLSSFSPFSPPGVHLVVVAPMASVSAGYFAAESLRTAQQLFNIYRRRAIQTGVSHGV